MHEQRHIFGDQSKRFTTVALSLFIGMASVEAAFADIVNTATASAQYSGVETVSQPSTESIKINVAPEITLLKEGELIDGGDGVANVGDTISYAFTVTNVGNVTLSGITVSDFDPDVAMSAIEANLPLTLAPGDSDGTTFTATYTLTQADIDAGSFSNDAQTTGTLPDGENTVSSLSDDPADETDADGDLDGNPDDTTVVSIAPTVLLETTKTMSVEDTNENSYTDAGDTVTYTITIQNKGNVTLTSVGVASDNLTRADATGLSLSSGPTYESNDGSSEAGTLAPNEIAMFTATYVLVQADVDAGGISNTATGTGTPPNGPPATDVSDDGNDIDGNTADDPTVLSILSPSSIFATKAVSQPSVLGGGLVEYTLTFENMSPFDIVGTDLIDILPEGVLYEPDSSLLNGIASEPSISGNRLTWSDVPILVGKSAVVTFSAVVSLGADGELTNITYALDSLTGQPISNTADATIERRIEPVFDCSDVIGKVFDDENYDGYQNQGEPGLPGIEIATVNGAIITVDKYGRFSVPCAAIPTEIGENFILKLDDRTLPTGYHVGTENPRVIRLTKGKISKLNFGAVITNIVRIELNSDAFIGGTANPSNELVRSFRQVIDRFSDYPLTLKVFYLLGDETERLTQARIERLEDNLHRAWSRNSQYKLNIQTTFIREE